VRVGPDGETLAIEERRQDFSHQLIEEFMLAANRAVAEYLVGMELPGIFRVHEAPDEDKLRELAEFLKSYKLSLKPPYTRGKLQQIVESVRGRPCEQAVAFATLTSLKQARYAATPAEHYALAFEPYCHFTSPIRRYPDLVVHRQLAGLYPAAGAELPPPGPGGRRKGARAAVADRRRAGSWMEAAASHASIMERRADDAERRLTRFRQLELLKRRAVGECGGVITSVVEFGIFVRLDEVLVDGLVHVSTMVDRYSFLRHRQELVGLRTGRRWRPGARVEVRILRVDPATGRLELELAGSS
jgi:ribonuclease R